MSTANVKIELGPRNMISMDKKYRTRNGRPVRILCLDMEDPDHPVVGLMTCETGFEVMACFTPEGRFTIMIDQDDFDLIEVSPYEDFKIDEPVMVRTAGLSWYKRHFAGVTEGGKPLAWPDGGSSFSTGPDTLIWDECRRPTPEEFGRK
jgi:hypothetical protein